MNISNDLDMIAAIGGIAAFLTTIYGSIVFLSQAIPSYSLIRGARRIGPHKRRFGVMCELALLARRSFAKWVRGQPVSLFKTVRVRLEYEIFDPFPEFDAAMERNSKVTFGSRQAEYRNKAKEWRGKVGDLYWQDGPQKLSSVKDAKTPHVLPLATCNLIHDNQAAITTYLDQIKLITGDSTPEFVTQVQVKSGFAAPLHLLTGLLSHFGDDWQTILDAYGRDVDPAGDPLSDLLKRDDVRKLQTFLFDCWLLWGPSIPICDAKCGWWAGAVSSVQFGYGDENNSIELIADPDFVTRQMENLSARSALAFRATARGRLKLSNDIVREDDSKFSPVLMESWHIDDKKGVDGKEHAGEDGRSDGNDGNERRVVLDIRGGNLEIAAGTINEARATYYSAYLWVLFVICREKNDTVEPVDSTRVWRSFLPFFEHGNIADRDTYRFLKRQLAQKAATGIARLVREFESKPGAGPCPLRFDYACAIDDSGCGNNKAFPSDADDESLKELLLAAIGNTPTLGEHRQRIIRLDTYDAVHHPYSACSLPELIREYYDFIKGGARL